MKNLSHFTSKFTAGVVALAMALLAVQARAETVPQTIQVLKVTGHARYSTDNKTWHNLNEGDMLDPGVVIQTATHSTVDLQFTDRAPAGTAVVVQPGEASPYAPPASPAAYSPEEPKANVVRVYESTVLAIDKISVERTSVDEVTDTQLDLRAGEIFGNVKKLSATSKYEIKIPNGVAGIRGSMYHLWASGELHMLSGAAILAIVGADGTAKTWLVNAHYGFNPTENRIFPLTDQMQQLPPGLFEHFPHPHGILYPPPFNPPPISPVR